ncbi:thermonuclease family protein [Sphingobacterium sp. InxBP1]|uniref:thermonuclease family protein n=1 Tax=Sphingobacterium sp. InxBP1 TaxID=2870328 RepID=UPI002244AC06|nr:thermonuclease family protein [Sphingobacterium sp. InxBP1]MCW8309794.1 thermonuclease family protein [Sphingobacterium sp. InxBP1]
MLKRVSFLSVISIVGFVLSSFVFKGEEKEAKVKRVIDGDTFVIENGYRKGEKVRLIGIDAPETRRTTRKEIGYYGEEAKEYLRSMLAGKTVRLVFDVGKRDRYGRLLAYVYLGDKFVNADLVKEGYAVTYTLTPNVQYAGLFAKLERQARQAKRGLWK